MIKLTGPIAVSELSWGASGFIYTLVFIHIGTTSLAASQITMAVDVLDLFLCREDYTPLRWNDGDFLNIFPGKTHLRSILYANMLLKV
jgi:hypothetical protein